MKLLLWLLLAESYSYWIQPCTTPLARESRCQAADPELGQWALEAWQRAAAGHLRFTPTDDEQKARLRLYWASGRGGLYGETRPIVVEGKPGAAVYVLPDLSHLGPEIDAAGRKDPLFRHGIVYLTCLHETGHAIGLPHTAAYDDIMYAFGYGGDLVEYFSRYRRQLTSREDIRKHSGMSAADRTRVREGRNSVN
ncbi:MAG: hypothetical protein HY238_15820 [Acidobacteria bacterium]|nr:hypothetical protein [Acidobacteriota bacterium]